MRLVRTVGLPHQGAGPERGQSGVEDVGGNVRPEQPGHLGARDGRLVGVGDHESLQHGEGRGVEVVTRPVHRSPHACSGGEHGQVRGRRHGEVGAQPDERGERRVVLGAQPVDQRGGHQIHGSLCANSDAEEEDHVAKRDRPERIDPTWPALPEGEHPLSELAAPVQGSFSPFGDVEFPLDEVPYEHPHTVINR